MDDERRLSFLMCVPFTPPNDDTAGRYFSSARKIYQVLRFPPSEVKGDGGCTLATAGLTSMKTRFIPMTPGLLLMVDPILSRHVADPKM